MDDFIFTIPQRVVISYLPNYHLIMDFNSKLNWKVLSVDFFMPNLDDDEEVNYYHLNFQHVSGFVFGTDMTVEQFDNFCRMNAKELIVFYKTFPLPLDGYYSSN